MAMSFTGPKVVIWKIHYINAFNDMEARLRGRVLPETPDGAAIGWMAAWKSSRARSRVLATRSLACGW